MKKNNFGKLKRKYILDGNFEIKNDKTETFDVFENKVICNRIADTEHLQTLDVSINNVLYNFCVYLIYYTNSTCLTGTQVSSTRPITE